jgi:hypothetical protein
MLLLLASILPLGFARTTSAADRTSPLIVNHHFTKLDQIPVEWINAAKTNIRWHYAHTSHGGQLTGGIERIEASNALYDVSIGYSSLPSDPSALCIFDGQETHTYVIPEEYYLTADGMNRTRNVLNHNPIINVSMFCWCGHMELVGSDYVQAYLDSMAVLEQEYPSVTFVYMTGHAQTADAAGHIRYLNNEQIRAHCVNNNKVLFDFAALDSHWFNPGTDEWEYTTYQYGGHDIPIEHPQFHGNEWGHTTYESCEQKGKAVWAMMAILAGWPNYTIGTEQESWSEIKNMFK